MWDHLTDARLYNCDNSFMSFKQVSRLDYWIKMSSITAWINFIGKGRYVDTQNDQQCSDLVANTRITLYTYDQEKNCTWKAGLMCETNIIFNLLTRRSKWVINSLNYFHSCYYTYHVLLSCSINKVLTWFQPRLPLKRWVSTYRE